MPRKSKKEREALESSYVGIWEQIKEFENTPIKPCPHCESDNTALVQVGIIGRSVNIAASTLKIKLVPNPKNKLRRFFCNSCGKFFN
jgi:hypothetical protein